MTDFRLDGQVVVVTGGAGLIGREVCDAMVAYGARVVVTDCAGQESLADQASRLRERYGTADVAALNADLTSDDDIERLFASTIDRFTRLDVLVNLAGRDAKFDRTTPPAGGGAGQMPRLQEYPLELWEESLAVNCTALLRVTQHCLRAMLPQRRGNIINVASTYSLVAPNQELYIEPGSGARQYKPVDYVATKSMVPNFTRYVATLYAREGIRCNAIVPHGVYSGHSRAFRERFARLSPLGRMCDVSELRGPFVFLASRASSYMTGSTLIVDGGWTAW